MKSDTHSLADFPVLLNSLIVLVTLYEGRKELDKHISNYTELDQKSVEKKPSVALLIPCEANSLRSRRWGPVPPVCR